MITPIEMQNKSLKTGLGYDKKDVDAYLKEIQDSYELIYSENVEFKDKISVLNERLQHYISIEKTLSKALIIAENTAEETKKRAEKEARQIEKEAQLKYHITLSEANAEKRKINKQTMELMHQYELYKAQFKSLVTAQIELLESDSFKINTDRINMLLGFDGINKDSDDDNTPGSDVEKIWKEPLPNIDDYLEDDDIKPDVSDVMDGQESLDIVNLEDDN